MRLLPPRSDLGWTPYLWLVYLAFYVAPAIVFGASTKHWIEIAAVIVIFLPIYFVGHWLSGWKALGPIAALVLLGAVEAPRNPGASVFFVYGAAFAAAVGPPRRAMLVLVGIAAALGAESAALGLPIYFWAPAAVVLFAVGGANIHFRELSRTRARLRRSEDEVARLARLAERERIARDLHDLLGHTLSLITLKSELAARLATRDPERAALEIREVERVSRQALREVRSAVAGYRGGLAPELASARAVLETAGIDFEHDPPPADLPPHSDGVLALALREAITNIVRHSGARRARVRFVRAAGSVRLEVDDDGHGTRGPEGAGLTGMRERVEEAGGRLERTPGQPGTRIVVILPVSTATTDDEAADDREAIT